MFSFWTLITILLTNRADSCHRESRMTAADQWPFNERSLISFIRQRMEVS